jgi:hypothetical protein
MKMKCKITREDALGIIREHVKDMLLERNVVGIPEPVIEGGWGGDGEPTFDGFEVEIEFGDYSL